MGYPMAKNLRKGLTPDHTLLICDVNKDAISRFQEETADQGPVRVVSSGFEAVQQAVWLITKIPSQNVCASQADDDTGRTW